MIEPMQSRVNVTNAVLRIIGYIVVDAPIALCVGKLTGIEVLLVSGVYEHPPIGYNSVGKVPDATIEP
jgi:hypothetical protein